MFDKQAYKQPSDMIMSDEQVQQSLDNQRNKMLANNIFEIPANHFPGLTLDKIKRQLKEFRNGNYPGRFKFKRNFRDLNLKQKRTYIVLATHMLLETGGIVNIIGPAGSGKSESVKKIYAD